MAAGRVAVVAAGAHRHGAAANEAETDGADRRGDDARRRTLQNLREKHRDEIRLQREEQRGRAGHENAERRQAPFPGDRVGKRAAGNLADHAGNSACRQRHADTCLRPARLRQIEGDEGAEAGLHVGDEEIHPVEAAPALRRRRHVQRAPRLAIPRGRGVQPGTAMIGDGVHGNSRDEYSWAERGKRGRQGRVPRLRDARA